MQDDELLAQAPRPSDMTGVWFVAQVQGLRERRIAAALAVSDVGFFLPMVKLKDRLTHPRRERWRLLFPNYIFVCGGANDREAKFVTLEQPGTQRLLPIVDQRKFLRQLDGIWSAISSGEYIDRYTDMPVGRKVRIIHGPMLGVEGTLIDRARPLFVVLIETLGQSAVAMELDPQLLEAA